MLNADHVWSGCRVVNWLVSQSLIATTDDMPVCDQVWFLFVHHNKTGSSAQGITSRGHGEKE
jgi:hypothetical protein